MGFFTVSQKHKPRGQVSVTSVFQLCSQKCHQQVTKPKHMASDPNRNTKSTLHALLSTLLLSEVAPGPKGLLVLTPTPTSVTTCTTTPRLSVFSVHVPGRADFRSCFKCKIHPQKLGCLMVPNYWHCLERVVDILRDEVWLAETGHWVQAFRIIVQPAASSISCLQP